MTNKKYPFKFLDAYTREDRAIFFGRDAEIQELYEMVFQTDLLLVYGASGTGKSSLIQCGLAGKFQSHDWLPIYVRRGSNLNESFEKELEKAGGGKAVVNNDTDLAWLDQDWEDEAGAANLPKALSPLAQRFKAIYLQHFKPVYLIFDQFEELYILGSKAEQAQFVETVKEILKVEQPVKILISIREEYLGELYEFEKAVPELLRKKLRVEPMNLDKVKTVISGINDFKEGNVSLQKGEETAIAEAVFDKIKGQEKTLTIQLPYLQVFLDKLYLQITADENRQAEAVFSLAELGKIGDIGDILRNFLDEQVLKIAQTLEQKPETIWKILSPFVTLEGTKEPITAEKLHNRLPDIKVATIQGALQAFVNSRIIRFTESEQVYEITHDSLAKQIKEKRSDEEIAILEVQRLIKSQTVLKLEVRDYFSEKQLLFIEPYLTKFRLETEEQAWIDKSKAHLQAEKEEEAKRQAEELAKVSRRNRILGSILVVALICLVFAGYFWYNANQQTKKAEKAKTEAQKSLIQSYQSEIGRCEVEIRTSKRSIGLFEQNKADNDVIELETHKVERLTHKKDSLYGLIQRLSNDNGAE